MTKRDCSIRFSVEEVIHAAAELAASNTRQSLSSYCRAAVIADLRRRGLLTDKLLVDIIMEGKDVLERNDEPRAASV